MALKGNKGEWAELYAFLKILSDGKLPSADSTLAIEEDRFFEFLKLYWNDKINGPLIYDISASSFEIKDPQGKLIDEVEVQEISSKLETIFTDILEGRGRSFAIPEAEGVLSLLHRTSLNAPSSDKADIFATILDRSTNTAELSGFSVKSMLKSRATLLNHSGQTLFRYQITGLTEEQAKRIEGINATNSNSKYLDKVAKIIELGGSFNFVGMSSNTFEKTLRKIDTMLPEFVAEMLVGFFSRKGSTLDELVEYLSLSHSLKQQFGFSLDKEDFEFKLKQLLSASALGMQPSKVWDGMMRANGGYLIVIRSGDVLCYHAFNRDVFLDYLFKNTKFESPGARTSPFLNMIFDGGKVYTDLKLQIRFI